MKAAFLNSVATSCLLGAAMMVAAPAAGHAQATVTGTGKGAPSTVTQQTVIGAGGAASEEITVTATRVARRIDTVPATVTVIPAERIENELATDIKDLVRFEPGVSVRSAPARFTLAGSNTGRDGNSGFNIRGLDGNRVLIQIDGVRVPDAFSFGGQSVGRGDYLDLDVLKSVEILRGPASALYGSDGLAGAVSFITKDPSDYLADGETFGGRVRASYQDADQSYATGLSLAARADTLSGLIAYTYRSAEETDTAGTIGLPDSRRTSPNPQEIDTHTLFGKLVWDVAPGHRLRLTGEYYTREVDTEVLSGRAILPTTTSTAVIDLDAHDETERRRVSFDYSYEGTDGDWLKSVAITPYWQDSQTEELGREDRLTAADRTRLNTFDNEVYGLSAQAVAQAFWVVPHEITLGGDVSRTQQEGIRDGTVPPVGETYPIGAFPKTDYDLAGLFLQDEISLAGGQLLITPALRYDYYKLDPNSDPAFPSSTSQSDDRFSPKLGVVWWPAQQFGAYANYAQGFKSPAPSQVNSGFSNLVSNYASISNPDLKPETSETYEIGLRMRDMVAVGAVWSGQVSAFTGDYEDFIEQILVSGNFTPSNPALYQFVNLSEVEIYGGELRLDGRWQNGLGLTFAASYAHGEETTNGVESPLNSIQPVKLVAGVSYRDPEGRFGGQAVATHSAKKDRSDIDQSECGAAGCFVPGGFTILDLTAWWDVTPEATLRLGVFNVFDTHYAWWSDARGLAATSTVTDAYTQPGRNFSASLVYRF